MKVPLRSLPRLMELLTVNGEPRFVVLTYEEFVRFVAATSPASAPDVITVLDRDDEHVFVILRCEYFAEFFKSTDFSGGVNEEIYFAKYPDVKAAVERGDLRSGTQHFIIQGYFEKREVVFEA